MTNRKGMGQRAGRAGGCPPSVPLASPAPGFSWLLPTFLQGNSWPKLQTTGGGWQGGCRGCPSQGASVPTLLFGGRDRLGYVFTSCFLKAGQALHLTPCLLPSICPRSRNLSVSFPPAFTEMLASREKGRAGGKQAPTTLLTTKQTHGPALG